MSDWIDVTAEVDLPPGSHQIISLDNTQVAVFNVDGHYYAIEDVCTHDGGELADGGRLEGDVIVCPRHGAKFCLKTGEPLAPPAFEPITTFSVQVKDGVIQVRDNRWDE